MINFEQDQQDAMSKTENIQSLADQVEMLEGLHKRIETSENNIKDLRIKNDELNTQTTTSRSL